jgi:hypothetical protein
MLLWRTNQPMGSVQYVIYSIAATMIVTGILGFWRLTTPLPAGSAHIISQRLPRIARPCMTFGLLGILLALISENYVLSQWMYVIRYTLPVIFILLAVGLWTTLMYGARLAMLVPQPSLARQARIVAWGYAAVMITLAMMVGLQQVLASSGVFGAVMMNTIVGTLVLLGIWSIPLAIWYRRRFLEAAKMAVAK